MGSRLGLGLGFGLVRVLDIESGLEDLAPKCTIEDSISKKSTEGGLFI